MSQETRKTLIITLVILAIVFFATGLLGHLIHKLDAASTLLLIGVFVVGSTGITWLTSADERRTRKLLRSLSADLAPHGLSVQAEKGEYTIISQGTLFDEAVFESLDLNELEAFVAGLRHGLLLAEAPSSCDGAMEARIALPEAQFIED